MTEYEPKPGQAHKPCLTCDAKGDCNAKQCDKFAAWVVACWKAFNRYLEAHT